MELIYRTKDNQVFDNERDAIYHEKTLEKNADVNVTQMLVFDLIKRASFNGFDGEKAVSYLVKNKDKWIGVMPEVEYYALRDIDDDSFNIDTLLVRCLDEDTARLFMPLLKINLSPDEINVEEFKGDYGVKTKNIIRLWWD